MKHRVLLFFPVVFVVIATLLLNVGGAEAASSLNCGKWNAVTSPNTSSPSNKLGSVATLSSNNVWAVGTAYGASGSDTLIEHWDGSQWSIVSSPNTAVDNGLSSIAAVSTNDIWAVGSTGSVAKQTFQTLVEHWDGSQWSVVQSPNTGMVENLLQGVAVVSATDVWTVGSSFNHSTGSQTLVEHWDGTQWSIIASPSPSSLFNELSAVTAVSATDVWAVGDRTSTNGRRELTLTEHWNGHQWKVVPSSSGKYQNNYLRGVSSVSSTDVWAVGDSDMNQIGGIPLIEHWNGSQWSSVSTPKKPGVTTLDGVAAISASNVWVVGQNQTISGIIATLIEHWNGSTWSFTASPNPSTYNSSLYDVSASSATNVWAVGEFTPLNGSAQTLTAFRC